MNTLFIILIVLFVLWILNGILLIAADYFNLGIDLSESWFTILLTLIPYLILRVHAFIINKIKYCNLKSLIWVSEDNTFYYCERHEYEEYNEKYFGDVTESYKQAYSDLCFNYYKNYLPEHVHHGRVNLRYTPKIVWKQFKNIKTKEYHNDKGKQS